eukprot:12178408-Heterocapsa_arctica.AAC.1
MPPLGAPVVLIRAFVGCAHEEDRARDVCDRRVRDLQSGKVQEQGAPDKLSVGMSSHRVDHGGFYVAVVVERPGPE